MDAYGFAAFLDLVIIFSWQLLQAEDNFQVTVLGFFIKKGTGTLKWPM